MNEPYQPAQTSGLAVASLICSLLCLSIPGVVCGHIGISKIRNSGGRLAGEGIAIAGLIFGYLGIAASVLIVPLVLAITLPAVSKTQGKAQEVASMSNLRQIHMACMVYADENDGALPSSLEGLETRGLRSPLAPDGTDGKYQLVLGGSLNDVQDLTNTPMVIDPHPTREGGQITVFADGHVSVVGADDPFEFEEHH